MTMPHQHLRRTPLRSALEKAGAVWTSLANTAIAESVGRGDQTPDLAIADLSPLPRIGFKGRETIAAMQKRGLTVEAEPNRVFRQPNGGLCLVLAPGEVIVLSPLSGDAAVIDSLQASWRLDDGERTYPLLRGDSHAYFLITGPRTPDFFAKICGVDLRPRKFPDLSIAQTSVAKLSAIVARADLEGHLAFHVLADSASALYFLDCLIDAGQEFGGRLVGHQVARKLETG